MHFKIFILHFWLLLLTCISKAQTLSPCTLSGLCSHSVNGNVSVSGTMGQPFSTKLAAANSIITQGAQQPEIQINTDTLATKQLCIKQELKIPFQALGYVDGNNVFTAQISDASGSFANPRNIGTMVGIKSGIITANLPLGLHAANHYKIRVVSSAPYFTGRPEEYFLELVRCPDSDNKVELIAQSANNGAILISTTPHTNGDTITRLALVERSTDGLFFKRVGSIDPVARKKESETFIDDDAHNGLVYYRLAEADDEGNYTYSNIVQVINNAQGIFGCYPNPASGIIYFALPINSACQITMYDMNGKMVLQQESNDTYTQTFDLSKLPSGVYFATYRNGINLATQKIVKQ